MMSVRFPKEQPALVKYCLSSNKLPNNRQFRMHDPLKVISEVSELISVGSDRPLNLNPILDAAVAGLGATKAFLFLNPSDEEKMALAASSGLSVAEFRRLDLAAEASILREIV